MVAAIIIAAVLLLLCIASYFAANVFANIVVHPDVHTYDYSRETVMKHCAIDPLSVLENHKVEEFRYKSEFGYELYGRIIRADGSVSFPDGRRRVVILCHGWTSNHITMFPCSSG